MRSTFAISFLMIGAFSVGQTSFPLPLRNNRMINLIFHRAPLRTDVLDKDVRETAISYSLTNEFRQLSTSTGKYLIEDYELNTLRLSYRFGIDDQSDFSVDLPLYARGSGVMDPIIDWWHEYVLHWVDKYRDLTPFGQSRVLMYSNDNKYGSASGIGDLSVTYAKKFSEKYVGTASLKLPTGDKNQLFGSGALDLSVGIGRNWMLGRRWTMSAVAGLTYQGVSGDFQKARRLVHQQAITFGHQKNSTDQYLIQWQSESSGMEFGLSRSDATQRIISFGMRHQASTRDVWELSISEDRDLLNGRIPAIASIGPDISIQIRWLRRL